VELRVWRLRRDLRRRLPRARGVEAPRRH
jgi:hypothetical protein